jgi:hypothetical protein
MFNNNTGIHAASDEYKPMQLYSLKYRMTHNSTERSPFRDAYSRSASQDAPAPYGILTSINEFRRARHGKLS